VNAGLRFDLYDGISRGSQLQPRLAASYYSARTGTVLRAAYSHSYETPLNENLVLSSATGAGGLATNVFGAYASVPLQPGIRNMYNVGFQQALGSHLVLDADYFWKFTQNAFDLDNLFTTAIFFPIEWDHSKMDGLAARLSLRQYEGLSGFVTLGHTRARVFGPENGGLIFGSPVDRSVVRIDHDQALQSTTHVQYQFGHNGPWVAVTWRYDSGIVSGAIPDLASVLGLTADQQWQIRFYCGDQVATPAHRITSCDSSVWGAPLVRIPAEGTANDDKNPARVSPRNLFNIGVGTDNLLHRDRVRLTLRFEALNVTNEVALFNFLSTCAGTHYVAPRSYRAELGVAF
jgi:outer membrane receptor protein involved in Fe transport